MQLSNKSSCSKCKNLESNGLQALCKAFPKGIPKQILLGENKHIESLEGETILFEHVNFANKEEND